MIHQQPQLTLAGTCDKANLPRPCDIACPLASQTRCQIKDLPTLGTDPSCKTDHWPRFPPLFVFLPAKFHSLSESLDYVLSLT